MKTRLNEIFGAALVPMVAIMAFSPVSALASASWVSSLGNQDLVVTVAGGELTYTLNTSIASGSFETGTAAPSAGNIGAQNGFSTFVCNSPVTTPVAGSLNPGLVLGCETVWGNTNINTGGAANSSTQTISGANLIQARVMTQAETTRVLASGYVYLVAFVQMREQGGVVQFVPFSGRLDGASRAINGGESAATDNDPGVSFAGFLISGASGRTVDAETAGTLRFIGKRLNQVASATIGGIAVTVTSATRSALELDFDSLPEGKHDVVLTSKSGAKTILRGFVTVN